VRARAQTHTNTRTHTHTLYTVSCKVPVAWLAAGYNEFGIDERGTTRAVERATGGWKARWRTTWRIGRGGTAMRRGYYVPRCRTRKHARAFARLNTRQRERARETEREREREIARERERPEINRCEVFGFRCASDRDPRRYAEG